MPILSTVFTSIMILSNGYRLGKQILQDAGKPDEDKEKVRKDFVKTPKSKRQDFLKKVLEDKIRSELEAEFQKKLEEMKK